MLNYEKLTKEIEKRKFNGYRNKDNIQSSGSSSSWGAGSLSVIGSLILMKSFTTDDDESRRMEKLKQKCSNLELIDQRVDDYLGNLISLDECYADKDHGLMIELNKGFLFPHGEAETYFRGFGHPKVYGLKDGEKLLDIREHIQGMKTKAVLGILSIPILGVPLYLLNPPAGLIGMGLATSYGLYNCAKGYINEGKKPNLMMPQENSIEKLCEVYAIE